MMHRIFLSLCLLALFSCRRAAVPQAPQIELSASQQVLFLDSLTASKAILDDDTEDFFGHIRVLDMSIQMKKNFPAATSREEVLDDYQKYLQEDVAGFTESEIQFVSEVLRQAFEICREISPALFPKTLELIKTTSRHYGPSVYYTRENRIVIPGNELEKGSHDDFLAVMFHELFHIYSRYHPGKREQLYQLIGFHKLAAPPALPPSLSARLLQNPDGLDLSFGIQVAADPDTSYLTVPLITSRYPEFNPRQPSFFSYLDIALYPLTASGADTYEIEDDAKAINIYQTPDFFRQIGNNTQYIIHPDEILADNFSFLALSRTGKPQFSLERFSEEGRQLIAEVEKIISNSAKQ